ncbi:MAG: hypothetical protein GY926_00835 [bacterium]|nr:hypothetical protein [bacterium]
MTMPFDLYSPLLRQDEDVVVMARATAGGTTTHLGRSAFIGLLGGWLYAIYLNAPLLPSLVLGAMTGALVGYVIAERVARQPSGPGAVHLIVVRSEERIVTIRRYPTFRQNVVRSYPLSEMSSVQTTPFPFGMYRRLMVELGDGRHLNLVVDDSFEIEAEEQSSDFGVD